MKILIITTDFYPNVSGIATLSLEQAQGLAALGNDVTVLTTTPSALSEADEEFGFKIIRTTVAPKPVLRLSSLLKALTQTIKTEEPDYLWCTNYRGFGLPVALAARLRKIPFGIYFHGTELLTEAKSSMRRRILKYVASSAQVVCTNSINTKVLLEKHYGVQATPLTPGVTPPAKDMDSQLRKDASKQRFQWLSTIEPECAPEDAFLFIAACRMSRQKGLYSVLEAMYLLPESIRKRALFIAAGSGPDLSDLQDLVSKKDLTHRVLFLGPLDRTQIPAALAACDCYLQPSEPDGDFLESFGISFLEAQAIGLPCIGSNWGGVPEAVKKDETALLVNPASPKDIAAAMETVMTDRKWRENAIVTAREWAKQNTWETHIKKLTSLIHVESGKH